MRGLDPPHPGTEPEYFAQWPPLGTPRQVSVLHPGVSEAIRQGVAQETLREIASSFAITYVESVQK
jgi:hypothetical protein